jgi:hypothetical protein|nr:MAG TPA: regulatory protein [Caudoviricetes sp.]
MELIKKQTITSLELTKQINIFRKEEYDYKIKNNLSLGKVELKNGHYTELRHDTLLNIIRDEFEKEITDQKILGSTYKDESGKENPYFELTLDQAKQILMRESKFVRKAMIDYINKLEKVVSMQLYSLPTISKEELNIKNRELEIKERELKLKEIEFLEERIEKYKQYEKVKLALEAQVTEKLTGIKGLLPMPNLEKTYSAGDVANKLSKIFNKKISSNLIGRMANKFDLKTKEFSELIVEPSKYNKDKIVESYRYKECSLKEFINKYNEYYNLDEE